MPFAGIISFFLILLLINKMMMMKIGRGLMVLVLALVGMNGMVNSQTITFIDDTANIRYDTEPNDIILDSLVNPKDFNKEYKTWKVYFDHNKKQLAFESYLENDSICIHNDYWRNGRLKRKGTFYKVTNDFFGWGSDETYCSNGQLLCKCCFNDDTLCIGYYCNGQKHFQYNRIEGAYANGLYLVWHENGQKMSEVNFVKHVEEGEKKYWDEKGKLQKIEVYKEGKLIETK